jgi:hypothetical protein
MPQAAADSTFRQEYARAQVLDPVGRKFCVDGSGPCSIATVRSGRSGQNEERGLSGRSIRSNERADLSAVNVGHIEVRDDSIRTAGPEQRDTVLARVGRQHTKAGGFDCHREHPHLSRWSSMNTTIGQWLPGQHSVTSNYCNLSVAMFATVDGDARAAAEGH